MINDSLDAICKYVNGKPIYERHAPVGKTNRGDERDRSVFLATLGASQQNPSFLKQLSQENQERLTQQKAEERARKEKIVALQKKKDQEEEWVKEEEEWTKQKEEWVKEEEEWTKQKEEWAKQDEEWAVGKGPSNGAL